MNLKHLFGILVMGGSVAAGCDGGGTRPAKMMLRDGAGAETAFDAEGTADAGRDSEATETEVDAPAGDIGGPETGAPKTGAPDTNMGSPCLCSPTRCCDQHEGAPATVQMGLVCCWGTSC